MILCKCHNVPPVIATIKEKNKEQEKKGLMEHIKMLESQR
jgi:hypothetical protein